jgi:hypothetical protein
MSQGSKLKFNNPGLFQPSVVRGVVDSGTPTGLVNFNDVGDRNLGTTSSFRYDSPGEGLRSTQQIVLDYTRFENHTFYQSAQVNVHLAFDRIINNFPFDGTRKEVEEFLDSLTGFERHVFSNIPKNIGYLFFSGSSAPDGGTHIPVLDFAGSVFPSISTKKTGENILDPGLSSFSWEMQLFVPDEINDNQTICQKISGSNQGISLFLSESSSSTSASLVFTAVSASSVLEATAEVEKGRFNHLVATFNRRPGVNQLQLYVNEQLSSESSNFIEFGQIDFTVSSFNIGSGSAVSTSGGTFTPAETLSGALDEFRFFHDVRTLEQQRAFARKAIFQTPELVLYYKFNEPSGSFGDTSTNRVVLDSSGNSLHAQINESGFDLTLRTTSSIKNPMEAENISFNPVLFPNYQPLVDYNEDLVASATTYDSSNPNLITKLVPIHYFLEGKAEEALETIDGTLVDSYTGESLPGTGDTGQAQILQSLLFIWAKFFDEMKIMIDNFGKTLHVTYDGENAASDQLLPKIAEYYGFSLPNLFNGASVEQFIDAENLQTDFGRSANSLQNVQNQIWRRILVNLKDIIRSKGTLHSVKSFIRAIGIDPDSNFRIREFGGPTKRSLSDQREIRTEVSTLLDMSGSTSLIKSGFLSGSRIEVGYPVPSGTLQGSDSLHGISPIEGDGLFTSGSWTVEGIYKFPKSRRVGATTQSLARLVVTGTSSDFVDGEIPYFNMLAMSGSEEVSMFTRPSSALTSDANLLQLTLTGVNVFDGNQWHISAGRFRSDDPSDYLANGLVKSDVSSSFFLRAARSDRGKIVEECVTSSFFLSHANNERIDAQEILSATINQFGSRLVIGDDSFASGAGQLYLSDTTEVPDTARTTTFEGRVGQVRFWSKGLLEEEWKEHVRNFKSVGVKDPLTNFNFVTDASGSFERLRIDASTDQEITGSDTSGEITIFDFSQNNLNLTGSGFEASIDVIVPETFYFAHISPKFDEASTTNKVRARGYQNFAIAEKNKAKFGTVHQIDPNEAPQDDTRFTIDFSIVDALDQDIVNIFSSLEALDNILGDPELKYSPDYPGLDNLRDVYFNRLTDKINLKSFFEFFKWFDRSIGTFIEALLPRKTKFRGVNFVIESHMLERAKYENLNVDQYLNAAERNTEKGVILLQQIVGVVKKY